MPNWVTNKIVASPTVIAGMLNPEGKIDFDVLLPSPCPHGKDWDGYYGDAETAAEMVCNAPTSDHELVRRMELHNRANVDIKKMNDVSFEQFVGMMRNFRECGYFHDMHFRRVAWGTKWNACEQSHSVDHGWAQFETAWNCPEFVLIALSKRFPEERISVSFADEDMGCNCGAFVLLNGEYVEQYIAPPYRDQTEQVREIWRRFACDVRGKNYDDYYGEDADE